MLGELERKVFSGVLAELRAARPELWEEGTTGWDLVTLAEDLLAGSKSIAVLLELISGEVGGEAGRLIREIPMEKIKTIRTRSDGGYSILLESGVDLSNIRSDNVKVVGDVINVF